SPPFGSTPHDRLSLEHSNTEVVPREALSQRSETGARDEYEELIHSYSVCRLTHWIRLSSNATVHLCYDFNFFVLLALIYWKGRPRLTAALQARSQLILRTMEEAQQLSKDARRRLAKVETLWAQLDSKIAAIRVVADAQIEKQEQALLAAAELARPVDAGLAFPGIREILGTRFMRKLHDILRKPWQLVKVRNRPKTNYQVIVS